MIWLVSSLRRKSLILGSTQRLYLIFYAGELSTDFPNMTTIANLFDAMEANPHFTDKPPSTTVVHFIDTLEAADPNSPDLSEDETDAQWGHKQLSGIWKGVLTSWDAIGCCDVATRLLAALLRTCRVARYVCSERRIQDFKWARTWLTCTLIRSLIISGISGKLPVG